MSAGSHARTPFHGASALLFTLLAVGLAYWLWQDLDQLLRLLKGSVGDFLRDLRLVVKVLAVFLLVSVAGLALDHDGAQSRVKRVVAIGLLVLLAVALLRHGTFFTKTIVPALKSILG